MPINNILVKLIWSNSSNVKCLRIIMANFLIFCMEEQRFFIWWRQLKSDRKTFSNSKLRCLHTSLGLLCNPDLLTAIKIFLGWQDQTSHDSNFGPESYAMLSTFALQHLANLFRPRLCDFRKCVSNRNCKFE